MDIFGVQTTAKLKNAGSILENDEKCLFCCMS